MMASPQNVFFCFTELYAIVAPPYSQTLAMSSTSQTCEMFEQHGKDAAMLDNCQALKAQYVLRSSILPVSSK